MKSQKIIKQKVNLNEDQVYTKTYMNNIYE